MLVQHVYLILVVSFILILLLTYSAFAVSNKQLARARMRYKIKPKQTYITNENAPESITF